MTNDLLGDTWASRDFPVLLAVARHFDRKDRPFAAYEVAAATDLELEEVVNAGRHLQQAGLVEALSDSELPVSDFLGVSTEARRLTGLWPSPEVATERLLVALERAIEQAPTEEGRGWLVKLRGGLLGGGRDVLVNAMGSAIGGQLPM